MFPAWSRRSKVICPADMSTAQKLTGLVSVTVPVFNESGAIDALYESRTKLLMSADAPPDDLYVSGDGAFEFQRTASRLHEMASADYLAAEREQAPGPGK